MSDYTEYGTNTVTEKNDQTVARGPRVSTIVWGLIIAVFGAGILAVSAFDLNIDPVLWAVVTLAAAGLILIVGSIAASLRNRKKE